jgi:hypothetical protein
MVTLTINISKILVLHNMFRNNIILILQLQNHKASIISSLDCEDVIGVQPVPEGDVFRELSRK